MTYSVLKPRTNDYLYAQFCNAALIRAGGADGGCNHRAQLITTALSSKGYNASKIWVWAEWHAGNPCGVMADMTDAAEPLVLIREQFDPKTKMYQTFNFHVAAVTEIDGADHVLDPAMFGCSVSVPEWQDAFLAAKGTRLHFQRTNAAAYGVNHAKRIALGGTEIGESPLRRAFYNARARVNLRLSQISDAFAQKEHGLVKAALKFKR